MAEVLYIAAAMRAPIVMGVGNRALSGPINIHCDHSDSMLVRDSGAIQLFAENAQEAYDLMLMATRIAEHPDVLLPVLVCQDGFTITHSAEPVVLLPDGAVREFVGPYRVHAPLLDVAHPTTQGPFAMPDSYFELRYQQVASMAAAGRVFTAVAKEFEALSGRRYRLVEPYRLVDADTAIVCLGSTGGTVKDVVDELRRTRQRVGLLEIRSFRPLPTARIRAALGGASHVAVLDRADSPGGVPPLAAEISAALRGTPAAIRSYVYGLGGRDLHPDEIRDVFLDGRPSPATRYLGLKGKPCRA
jgi:pyruvate ferredoxin oxidoreductase alpha subunit